MISVTQILTLIRMAMNNGEQPLATTLSPGPWPVNSIHLFYLKGVMR